MGLESGTYISDLVITNPTSSDPRSQGDDHLRLIKTVAKNSLPKDLRGVSSPLLGDSLRYDGTSFANPSDIYGLVIDRNVSVSVNASSTAYLTFTQEYLDSFGIFAPSSTDIVMSANMLKFRADLFIECAVALAGPGNPPTGFVLVELVNTTLAARSPFVRCTVPMQWDQTNLAYIGWMSLGAHLNRGYNKSWPNAADVLKLQITNGTQASLLISDATLVLTKI